MLSSRSIGGAIKVSMKENYLIYRDHWIKEVYEISVSSSALKII